MDEPTPTHDEARKWALSEGARAIPWAELESGDDHDLFGIYDDDGGLFYIHSQWQAALGDSATFDWVAAAAAAVAAVDNLELRGRIPDTDEWRQNVRARTRELTSHWADTVKAFSENVGPVTVGLDDPRDMRRTYAALRKVLERLPHTVNSASDTVILTTDAAVGALLNVYSDMDLRVSIEPGNLTPSQVEIASTLWTPGGDGAYPTLAAAIHGAKALTKTD